MIEQFLRFVRPDGVTAKVTAGDAREIADALWELEFEPGAIMAAARITEALRARRAFTLDVIFSQREIEPLMRIAPDSVSWATSSPPMH